MNGAHDLGGIGGFGPVEPEVDEPVFHAEWERRAFALTLAAGFLGKWNLDMSRHAREKMDPAEYLATSYYEHWLHGLELLLVEKGLVTEQEINQRVNRTEEDNTVNVLRADQVWELLQRGGSARFEANKTAQFAVGDWVVTKNLQPPGHIRLPAYVRGCTGQVDRDHGEFILPDKSAEGQKISERLYSVRFEGKHLWDDQVKSNDAVYVDLFESYLLPK